MKPFIILISVITFFSLVSCEKQETGNFLSDIEGKWELAQIVFGHSEIDPVSTLDFDETYLEFLPCDIDDNMTGSGHCEARLEMNGNILELNCQIKNGSEGTSRLFINETGVEYKEDEQLMIDRLKKLSDIDFINKKNELFWKSDNPFSSEFPSTAILKRL